MTEPIPEINEASFDERVVGRSRELPVLVDFWAPWCAPCRMLTPILAKVAEEYAGKCELVAVNIDNNPNLARELRIQSIPWVKLYRDGEVAEEFLGVQSEQAIRAFLERHIERPSDRLRQAAAAALGRGDPKGAEAMLREALGSDPDNDRVHLDLAHLLVERGDSATRKPCLTGYPPGARWTTIWRRCAAE